MGATRGPVRLPMERTITRAITQAGAGGQSLDSAIRALFANGEQGAWYDPSDFSTMFQDSAGIFPVTAVGQPVGKILDKSGRGNHASQATAAARPVLSARKNLLTNTEDFADATWAKTTYSVVTNATTAPNGTTTANEITTSGGNGSVTQGVPVVAGGQYVFSFYAKKGTAADAKFSVYNNTAGADIIAPTSYGSSLSLSDWVLVEIPFTAPAGCTYVNCYTHRDTASAGTTFVWGVQLEQGTAATRYQRVNTATDYDTEGFPYYVKLDGVDDGFGTTFPAGTLGSNMDCFMLVRRNAATQAALMYGQSASEVAALVVSGDGAAAYGNAGTPTYAVNGAAVTATRGALHTALPVGNWCVLEVRNLNLSTWTALRFGDLTSNRLNGAIAEVILAPAQDAEKRTKVREYLAAKGGIAL